MGLNGSKPKPIPPVVKGINIDDFEFLKLLGVQSHGAKVKLCKKKDEGPEGVYAIKCQRNQVNLF